VPGKVDWLARAQPTQREGGEPRIGPLARTDVATCALDSPVADIRAAIEPSPYGFALVLTSDGTILGRVRKSRLGDDPTATAESVMDPGPSTVRPDLEVAELRKRLEDKNLRTAIVSMPEGQLIGIVRRDEL
jgi:CBS domain-containing protein